jgi:hypothetical protein
MHVAAHVSHAAQPRLKAKFQATFNQAFDQKASDEFDQELREEFRQHGRIMALSAQSCKPENPAGALCRCHQVRNWLAIVDQIPLVCELCRAMVNPEVVPACGFQALVAQNLFDVPDGTAIEEQLRGGGVS